ncbi:hypothetical protein CB7_103 [Pectobacterium phage vB_PatM_CB7]|nr:hypothetical protein CB7_103 [Pectobacterium phage vB_PatM_CB7]
MFERTKSRDEEHVDERAYKFFSYMYGREGHHYGWNSTKEGIRPTTVLSDKSTHVCAYCGRMALPIQGERWDHFKDSREYFSKGHCCVCKKAMDELEMMDQLKIIEDQFENARSAVYRAMPKTNPDIVAAFVDRKAEQVKKDLKFWNSNGTISPHSLDKTGLELRGPRYVKGDYDE